MAEMKIIIFEVEHGFCAFIRSPNGYGLMIDCGCTEDFSPVEYILKNEASTLTNFSFNAIPYKLTNLTISHPHDDHIQDISRLSADLPPGILIRENGYEWDSLKKQGEEGSYENLETYSQWQATYNLRVSAPDWGMTLKIGPSLSIKAAKKISEGDFVNNSSLPVFIEYKGIKLVFPGDLMKSAWLELLKNEEFRDNIKGTSVFVTSHHGHSSGYCKDIYDAMGKPFVNIVATHRRDPSVEGAYSSEDNARGFTHQGETRRMLTTRTDGSIFITVREDDDWSIWAEKLPPNLKISLGS